MDWGNLFLSYEGRINRKPYWLANIAFGVIYFSVTLIIIGMAGIFNVDPTNPDAINAAFSAVNLPLGIFNLLCIWPAYAILAKRWHDHGKSGWWSLIIFVPIIGAIWMLVECGFLRGSEGPNQYGQDPLA